MSMGKSDYVERITQDNRPRGFSKQVIQEIVDDTFSFIIQSLKNEKKFTYAGFGSLRLKRRKSREGRHPQTGEKIMIPARNAISFVVSGKLKKTLR